MNFYNTEVISFQGQDFETLKRKSLRTGELFTDSNFDIEKDRNAVSQKHRDKYHLVFKRAPQFCKDPKLFVNSFTQYDICQGVVGNCWFVAACSAIATVPEVFEKVVPRDQTFDAGDYAGIFHFRFWLYGKWYDVVVDDILPVAFGKDYLVFSKNVREPNEFWAPLIEKAYAKVYGGYDKLDKGDGADALTELTGGIRQFYDLNEYKFSSNKVSELWNWFYKTREQKSLAVAAINSNSGEILRRDGLVAGHEYAITDANIVNLNGTNVNLIRMRNPWGNDTEWNGAWSDNSREWSYVDEGTKRRLKFKIDADGEFWMSFDEFIQTFHQFQIVYLTLDSFSTRKYENITWKMMSYEDSWIFNLSAGGRYDDYYRSPNFWDNPQLLISISQASPVLVALMIKDRRENDRRYVDSDDLTADHGYTVPMSFTLYHVLDRESVENSRKTGQKLYARHLLQIGKLQHVFEKRSRGAKELVNRFDLQAGDYLIIPATEKPNVEGNFLIRIFSEEKIVEKNAAVLVKKKENLDKADLFFSARDVDKEFKDWNTLLATTANESRTIRKPKLRQAPALLDEKDYESASEDYDVNRPMTTKSERKSCKSSSSKRDKDCVAM